MTDTGNYNFYPISRELSLSELLAGATTGYSSISSFGRLGEHFGGGFHRLYALVDGVATEDGVHKDGSMIRETTLLEVYRHDPELHKAMVSQFTSRKLSQIHHFPSVSNAIFCAYTWSHNYQHFLIEVLPRIWMMSQIRELDHLPIIVSDFPHIREIVEHAFPTRQFIFIRGPAACVVTGTIFFCGAVSLNMAAPLPTTVTDALRHLRTAVLSNLRSESALLPLQGAAFFGRRPDPSYAGNSRVMTNFDEFEIGLKERNITISDFDGKTLPEKAALVSEISFAISPVGANLMNLIFAPLTACIVIIDHPVFMADPFFTSLFAMLGFKHESIKRFTGTGLSGLGNTNDNAPYFVNIEAYQHFHDKELI